MKNFTNSVHLFFFFLNLQHNLQLLIIYLTVNINIQTHIHFFLFIDTMYFIRVMTIDKSTNTFVSDNIILLSYAFPTELEQFSARNCMKLELLTNPLYMKCGSNEYFEQVFEVKDLYVYKDKGAILIFSTVFQPYTSTTIFIVQCIPYSRGVLP